MRPEADQTGTVSAYRNRITEWAVRFTVGLRTRRLPGLAVFSISSQMPDRSTLGRAKTRERHVVALRYGLHTGRPLSLRETGKVLGLSGERVRLIEREALRKLRDSEIVAAAVAL